MRIIFLGAPGSGKGTMASAVSDALKIAHISTGDLFRKHLAEKTDLGRLAEGYMSQGKLVPDDVTVEMVKNRLLEDDARKGFIFDGFPRTVGQAESLDRMLKDLDLQIDAVIDLVVPEDELFRRITTRRVCKLCGEIYNVQTKPTRVAGVCDKCGGDVVLRPDDNPDTLRKRLDVYYAQTEPLISYYQAQERLLSYDNVGKNDSGTGAILDLLEVKRQD